MTTEIRGELNAATFKVAETLPKLLSAIDDGIDIDSFDLHRAQSSATTVTTVADLLEVAMANLHEAPVGDCRVCLINYENPLRVILVMCSYHCYKASPRMSKKAVVSHSASPSMRVLEYLSKLFGHKKDLLCALCVVKIRELVGNPLGKKPNGDRSLRNGAFLTFELCHQEEIRMGSGV